tara:strand:- start:24 stop:794 length:771 start_codon:yes stop_codon:yes gene_type:complete
MDFLIGIIILAILLCLPIDLYKYEIPDVISNGLILIGILVHSYLIIYEKILFSDLLISLGFGSFIGLGLFFSGNWGGGDAKLLIGISAAGAALKNTLPFIIEYTINLILAGGIYSIFIVYFYSLKNYKKLKREKYLKELFILTAVSMIFLPAGMIFLVILTMYLSYIIQTKYFDKEINTKDLVEGDWVVEKIYHNKKLVYSPRKIGLLKKDIKLIQQCKKFVKVKGGIAFAPAFFIAIIFTLNYPDIIFDLFLARI